MQLRCSTLELKTTTWWAVGDSKEPALFDNGTGLHSIYAFTRMDLGEVKYYQNFF